MKIFTFGGKRFTNINGKDFFLLRYYQIYYGQPVFYQVTGSTPLLETDLEGRSKFGLVKTKTPQGIVVTVFAKEYFQYGSEADSQELCFVGQTTAGSYFLALKYLAERFSQKHTFEKLAAAVPEAVRSPLFEELADQGNSGQAAVKVRVGTGYRSATPEEFGNLLARALSTPSS